MKKFLLKIAIIALPFLMPALLRMHFDTFNVFHWKNIRFTSAEPNKNFVKTQYIIHNPKKFNAFIFGSSRVGNIPSNFLPQEKGGVPLRWYNMTHSVGTPNDHFMTISTFLKNGVSVDMVIVEFDEISMYRDPETQRKDLLRMPFQVYEENPIRFYAPYLKNKIAPSIIKEIGRYNAAEMKTETERFYEWGGCESNFSLTENPQMERYEIGHFVYSQKNAHKDIEKIATLCSEHNINLVLFTSPMYQTLYRNSVEDGYFDFLRAVAQKCEFYNFSALNNYTVNPQYYYEWSHYRPALGLLINKILFGTDEDRERIRRDAGDALWGARVNAENIDEIAGHLQIQIESHIKSHSAE